MDKNKISQIVKTVMNNFDCQSYEVFVETNNVLRIEVVSNLFLKMRLIKRIDLLSILFEKSSSKEFFDFHLVFNPLTINEKILGLAENEKNELSDEVDLSKISASDYSTY